MSFYTKIIDLQKLKKAWEKVRSNKPSPGIDDVTWEAFDGNLAAELKELNGQLKEQIYTCHPVKMVTLYKDGKERPIALFSMRDKVVQQSVAEELMKMYDSLFCDSCAAYRPGRSALAAAEVIEERVRHGRYSFALKLDIVHFFENIRWEILEGILAVKVRGEDERGLLKTITLVPSLGREGSLDEKKVGLYQGSSLSPVMSNIYMMEFDRWLDSRDVFYIRYSDDMLLLGESEEKLKGLLGEIQSRLTGLGLTISEEKSELTSVSGGFSFLGYRFDLKGKSAGGKAEKTLSEKLEMIWLLNRQLPCPERLGRMGRVLEGWRQYFRGEREIRGFLEYAALLYMASSEEDRVYLAEQRRRFRNIYLDLMEFFQSIWKNMHRTDLVLLEYEQYFGISDGEEEKDGLEESALTALTACCARALKDMSEEAFTELMQTYADLHQYGKVEKTAEIIDKIRSRGRKETLTAETLANAGQHLELVETEEGCGRYAGWPGRVVEKFLETFSGREDMYALLEIVDGRKRHTVQYEPLTESVIRKHLAAEITAGTYVQRVNGTARFLVIDIDISRKILLQYGSDRDAMQKYLREAADLACKMGILLDRKGLKGQFEFSGFRGYHIWIFFDGFVPVRLLHLLQDQLADEIEDFYAGDIVTVEYFPDKSRSRPDNPGRCMKLPLCLTANGGRSLLLNDDFSVCENEELWMDNAPRHSITALKRALAAGEKNKDGTDTETKASGGPLKREEERKQIPDGDLSGFGNLSSSVMKVLEHCSLMRYLCKKALDTGYLTHFERQTILYVFGHMGEEGKNFVHQVMSYTLNYQYNVTDRFIRKCPEKPVSCVKLREQYKRLTAEIGCSCTFKRRADCYPSPVLHAISQTSETTEQITLPVSRTLTKEKTKEVVQKLNVHSNAQTLLNRILEMKKQRRGIDLAIRNFEKELNAVFEEAGTDRLEIDMGTLVRIVKGDGTEWKIEI